MRVIIAWAFIFWLTSASESVSQPAPTASVDYRTASVIDHTTEATGSIRGMHGGGVRLQRSFKSDEEADRVFARILAAAGRPELADRIIFRASAEAPNAFAANTPNGPVIFYNPVFMQNLQDRAGGIYWTMVAVLAHEVAHHYYLHPAAVGRDHEFELEADRLAGKILATLCATWAQSIAAYEQFPDVETPTHPARSQRIASVTLGWREGKCNAALTPEPVSASRPAPQQVSAAPAPSAPQVAPKAAPASPSLWTRAQDYVKDLIASSTTTESSSQTRSAEPKLPEATPEEEAGWQVAKQVGSVQSFTDFLKAWPSGRYAAAAQKAITEAKPKSLAELEAALKAVNAFIGKKTVNIGKVEAKGEVQFDDKGDVHYRLDSACRKDGRGLDALRGMALAFALYDMAVNAVEDQDIGNLSGDGQFYPSSTLRTSLLALGQKDGLAALSKHWSTIATAVRQSSDLKAFLRLLQSYKAKYEAKRKRGDQSFLDANYRSIAENLGDPASNIPCLNQPKYLLVGNEVESRNQHGGYGMASPHGYFYSFWHRRQMEGTTEVAEAAIKWILAR